MAFVNFATFFVALTFFANMVRSNFTTEVKTGRFFKPGNVTIGLLLPLHTNNCEKLYSFGLGYVEAVTFAVETINKDKHLLPNVSLGFDVRDYCDNPAFAMKSAFDFVSNNRLTNLKMEHEHKNNLGDTDELFANLSAPISAMIGTEDSSSSVLVASLLHVVKIPTVSAFATSEELSSPFYDDFLRTISPDGQQARAMVDIIEYFNWTYVAAVAIDHSYGRYGIRALERVAYNRRTFCIAFSEYFTRTGYLNKIESIVRKLKRERKVQVIILWSNYEAGMRFLKEVDRQKVYGRTWLISEAIGTMGPEVLEKYTHLVDGLLGILPTGYIDAPFEEHLKTRSPFNTAGNGNPWWEELWKMEGCPKNNRSSEACKNLTIGENLLEEVHNAFVPYLTDAVYAIAEALDAVYKCKEPFGLLPFGKCPQTRSSVKPEDTLIYLRQTKFQGRTGLVGFNKNGDPLTSSYDIINFQRSKVPGQLHVFKKIGNWSGNQTPRLKINTELIRWYNSSLKVPESVCAKPCPPGTMRTNIIACCWECIKCPPASFSTKYSSANCTPCLAHQKAAEDRTQCIDLPLANIMWSEPQAIIFSSLTNLGLLLTVGSFLIFLKHQETPLVKASNRELSFVLLASIAVCFALTFLYIAKPTNVICCLRQALRYVAHTVCVSVLFLKTNRIVRAFQIDFIPHWCKKYILGRRRQLLVIGLLNTIEVLLVVLWFMTDPSTMHQDIQTGKFIFLTCKPHKTVVGETFQAVIFTYLIVMSLLCAFYAFKARKVPGNFNETKYIGFSMYIFLISWIAFYPVDSTLEGPYITTVACATTLISAYGMLICMFAPKVFIILFHAEQNTSRFTRAEVGSYTAKLSLGLVQRVRVRPVTSETKLAGNSIQNDRACDLESNQNSNQNESGLITRDPIRDPYLKPNGLTPTSSRDPTLDKDQVQNEVIPSTYETRSNQNFNQCKEIDVSRDLKSSKDLQKE